RDAAEVPAGAHRADEDAVVEEVVGEPDAVAEQRPPRERAGGIDRHHADLLALRPQVGDDARDQARLPHTGRPGEPDDGGLAGLRVELAHELVGQRVAVLDERDRPRHRTHIAAADPLDEGGQIGRSPAHRGCSARPRAAANAALSSGVPTVTRMLSGDPNGASGRTMTPSCSSARASARPSPASAVRKLPTDGSGSIPASRSAAASSARPRSFRSRRRATSSGSSMLASAAAWAISDTSNGLRTFIASRTTSAGPTRYPIRRPARP